MDRFSPGGKQYFGDVSRHYHPSFPLVKPVRNFRLSLCLTIAFAGLIVGNAAAQQSSSRGRSVRQSERVARAQWQPTRSSVAEQEPEQQQARQVPANPVRQRQVTKSQTRGVRAVDHIQVEGVPILPQESSIIDPPVHADSLHSAPVHAAPLDGQISLEPLHSGSACDALPGGCGCGDSLCLGGCDAIGGCDSCGGILRRRGLWLRWLHHLR